MDRLSTQECVHDMNECVHVVNECVHVMNEYVHVVNECVHVVAHKVTVKVTDKVTDKVTVKNGRRPGRSRYAPLPKLLPLSNKKSGHHPLILENEHGGFAANPTYPLFLWKSGFRTLSLSKGNDGRPRSPHEHTMAGITGLCIWRDDDEW